MKWKLAGMIAAFGALICAVIVFASPYTPVVGGVTEIETLWKIEDARTESEAPLVTGLTNHGVPLAYDAYENTFYCTLGMENGESWPELYLHAQGADGVQVVFSDDYTYDSCADAIREGYSYELMAYTDTEYAYFYMVFTGLPQVVIHADEEIQELDAHAAVSIAAYGEETAQSGALVHLRGAGSAAVSDKESYRIDFVRGAEDKNNLIDVPKLGMADDVILISMTTDATMMRDKLSWDLYARLADGTKSFGARQTEYAEVFVNDEYMGLYLMMQPVDIEEELLKSGAELPLTDSVYRSFSTLYIGDRPYVKNAARDESGYELFYTPSQTRQFEPLERYMALELETDDEAFAEQALAVIDMDSMLRQYLFVQAGGMSDNVYNNMYVWAHHTPQGVKYRFAPWDMDLTWGRYKEPGAESAYQGLFNFVAAQRMIDLDVGGAQEKLVSLWTQMRRRGFDEATVEALVNESTALLSDSGAYARNAYRWGLEESYPDGYGIVSFASEHFAVLDELFEKYGYKPE